MLEVRRITTTKKPTLDELKEILLKEGLECELFSDKPATRYGRHKHNFDDFIVRAR